MSKCCLYLTVVALCICSNSFADYYGYTQPLINTTISVERLQLDPAIAERELIDDTALALNFGIRFNHGRIHRPHIQLGLGGSFVYFHDKGSFIQDVYDEYGHYHTLSSKASALHLYVEGGPTLPLGSYSTISLNGGYTLPFISERSIQDCFDCYTEAIAIDGGLYSQVSMSYNFGHFNMDTHYKNYLHNDNGILHTFSLGISGRY